MKRVTVDCGLFPLKMSAVYCVVLLFIVVLAGCATYEKQKQEDSFEDITELYGTAIRWGKYEVANGFRQKSEDEEKPDFEYLKNIKVTSYELKAVNVSSDGNTVEQDVEIEYYILDQFIERTIIDSQLWKYNSEEDRWYLHSELPDFR